MSEKSSAPTIAKGPSIHKHHYYSV